MDAEMKTIARTCLDGAAADTMTFPEIVGALSAAGFESYVADLRRSVVTYYLPSGESLELPSHATHAAVASRLDLAAVRAAIHEAQTLAPGYSYRGFCAKVMSAGVAGYMVSFSGRRAVYFARTGETHVELFPTVA